MYWQTSKYPRQLWLCGRSVLQVAARPHQSGNEEQPAWRLN